MTERPIVVISSTALDLPAHRREAMAACLSVECVPKMMEHLPAIDADAIQASLALVDQADVYLGVFAYRYGYIPKGYAISITEMELQRAKQRKLPCLIFLIHEDHPVIGKDVETGEGAEKLKALKAGLGTERVVGFFSSPADLRAKVLQSLVALREQLRDEAKEGAKVGESTGSGVDRPPPTIENNPYRSLSAFQEADASVFYGRDALVRETLATFYGLIDPNGGAQVRLLAILGPSGSGKSSFARAGLAAQLNQKASDQQSDLRIFTFVPGEHPMSTLTQLIRQVCGEQHEPPTQTAGPTHQDHNTDQSFSSPLETLPAGGTKQLVLIVDQFEEVYSLCSDEAEQNTFIHALMKATKEPKGRVSVILTLRSDFLSETQRHGDLNTAIAKNALIVPAMSAQDLRLAITEPAKGAGYPIDEKTVGQLIDETIGREGVLPLLQFVLSAIWQGMASGIAPADTLTKLGGVGGALANQAEELYQALPVQSQQIARRAFLGMVQLGEGAQDTRRRVPVEKLIASDSADQVLEVLNAFAKPERRLVSLNAEADQTLAEVTHEALFSHWGRLQVWLRDGRDAIRFQRRLEDAADEWYRQRKDPIATGLLWRPPLLSLLSDYHEAHHSDMSKEDLAFYETSKDAYQHEIDTEQARTRLLQISAITLAIVASLAIGISGFFAFATIHGLDPGETLTALMIRSGLKPLPEQKMIRIEPGKEPFPVSFTMGSDSPDSKDNEMPPHNVTINKPFAIGQHEVTFEQYDVFVEATHGTNVPYDLGWGRGTRPVINVSWTEAQAYAKWLSVVTGITYRLPTEAEWEYVARAGTEGDYWWCEDKEPHCAINPDVANCSWCDITQDGTKGRNRTVPVGTFPANPFGLHDTAGNVTEWVEDCWHADYQEAPQDGAAWLEANGGNCDQRVLRGGSWFDSPRYHRSAFRNGYYADYRDKTVGFRLAQDL